MSEHYDAVIVGARVAGSALAIDLARAGLSVALVDRAHFPSDVISTHFFQRPGVAALERLGVLDRLRRCEAPFVNHVDLRVDDIAVVAPFGTPAEGGEAALCLRRTVLDDALVKAAAEAGAAVHTANRVTALVEHHGRVTGVAVSDDAGSDRQLDAPLVVGADGVGSTVARLTGARNYHVTPNARLCYYGYFEGVTPTGPAPCIFHRFDEDWIIGFPCDAGLFVAAVLPPLGRLGAFTDDLEGTFTETLRRDTLVSDFFVGARRIGPLRGMTHYPTYFRESAGPGWALVGDAGHFKDPVPGQGICDAFRQAERLADEIVAAVGTDGCSLDDAAAAYWAWRDEDAYEMHWFANDLGAAGTLPVVLVEFFRELVNSPAGMQAYCDIFHRLVTPSEVLTPEALTSAAARLARTPSGRQAKLELEAMTESAVHRQSLWTDPQYETGRMGRGPSTVSIRG